MALQAAQKASLALLLYLGCQPDFSNAAEVIDANAAMILAIPSFSDKSAEPVLVHDAGPPSWLREDDF